MAFIQFDSNPKVKTLEIKLGKCCVLTFQVAATRGLAWGYFWPWSSDNTIGFMTGSNIPRKAGVMLSVSLSHADMAVV